MARESAYTSGLARILLAASQEMAAEREPPRGNGTSASTGALRQAFVSMAAQNNLPALWAFI